MNDTGWLVELDNKLTFGRCNDRVVTVTFSDERAKRFKQRGDAEYEKGELEALFPWMKGRLDVREHMWTDIPDKPATKPCSPCGDGDTDQQHHVHATGSGEPTYVPATPESEGPAQEPHTHSIDSFPKHITRLGGGVWDKECPACSAELDASIRAKSAESVPATPESEGPAQKPHETWKTLSKRLHQIAIDIGDSYPGEAAELADIAKLYADICDAERPTTTQHNWWCDGCSAIVAATDVTFEETHDIRKGGCGQKVRVRRMTVDAGGVETLTRTRTEEIRARVEKATPGPWVQLGGQFRFGVNGGNPTREPRKWQRIVEYDLDRPADEKGGIVSWDDAQFIVNARDDVSYLLTELTALLDENKRLRGAITDLLMSADASWYERNAGHDWREAYDRAAALTPSPAQEEQ